MLYAEYRPQNTWHARRQRERRLARRKYVARQIAFDREKSEYQLAGMVRRKAPKKRLGLKISNAIKVAIDLLFPITDLELFRNNIGVDFDLVEWELRFIPTGGDRDVLGWLSPSQYDSYETDPEELLKLHGEHRALKAQYEKIEQQIKTRSQWRVDVLRSRIGAYLRAKHIEFIRDDEIGKLRYCGDDEEAFRKKISQEKFRRY